MRPSANAARVQHEPQWTLCKNASPMGPTLPKPTSPRFCIVVMRSSHDPPSPLHLPPNQTTPTPSTAKTDKGTHFLIARFATQAEAEAKAAELARGGHKQHYFVQRLGPE